MTHKEALELIDRLRDIRRADFVSMCREEGMEEADILLLLAQEPVMAPIEIKKFTSDVYQNEIQLIEIEKECRAIDPELMREIVDATARRLGLSPEKLELKTPTRNKGFEL